MVVEPAQTHPCQGTPLVFPKYPKKIWGAVGAKIGSSPLSPVGVGLGQEGDGGKVQPDTQAPPVPGNCSYIFHPDLLMVPHSPPFPPLSTGGVNAVFNGAISDPLFISVVSGRLPRAGAGRRRKTSFRAVGGHQVGTLARWPTGVVRGKSRQETQLASERVLLACHGQGLSQEPLEHSLWCSQVRGLSQLTTARACATGFIRYEVPERCCQRNEQTVPNGQAKDCRGRKWHPIGPRGH